MLEKLKSLKNKLFGATVLASAAICSAAPVDQLDSLNQTLTTVSTKAETISGAIIAIVTISVIMVIVIGWLKKGKKAAN